MTSPTGKALLCWAMDARSLPSDALPGEHECECWDISAGGPETSERHRAERQPHNKHSLNQGLWPVAFRQVQDIVGTANMRCAQEQI
ncbi:hypothetical protein DEDE109153_08655 [Deinococcus deserti]